MREKLEVTLQAIPPARWEPEQVVVFDWYDGPREGVCSLKKPKSCFYFQLLAERATADDLDDRLFGLSCLPNSTITRLSYILSDLGSPSVPVWVPMWNFPSLGIQKKAEQEIESLLATRQKTPIIIYTRDMKIFLGCWNIEWSNMPTDYWFSFLGL